MAEPPVRPPRADSPHRWVIPLIDDNNRDQPPIFVEVRMTAQGIEILARGYGNYAMEEGEGSILWLEHYNGRLRISMWEDIREEDPTYTGHFEHAREELREE